MQASEKFREGKLDEAVAAAVREVKERPGDAGRRTLLAELLCFAGDFSRADVQLDAVVGIEPSQAVWVSLLRQLIRAEGARRQLRTEGRVPEFLEPPPEELRLRLRAAVCLREGNAAEAAEAIGGAEALRPRPSGSIDGKPFDDLRDLDDMTASFLEVLTSTGKYFWVPFEKVEAIELAKPERPHDLLWRRARLAVRGGPDGEVWIPALYAGSEASADDRIRLGRATEWTGGEGSPVRGAGQRIFLAGDRDLPVLEIGKIEMAPAAGGGRP